MIFFYRLLKISFSWLYQISTYVYSLSILIKIQNKFKPVLKAEICKILKIHRIFAKKFVRFIFQTYTVYTRNKSKAWNDKFRLSSLKMNHLTIISLSFMIHSTNGIYLSCLPFDKEKKCSHFNLKSSLLYFSSFFSIHSYFVCIYFYKCRRWNSNGMEKKSWAESHNKNTWKRWFKKKCVLLEAI